MASDSLSQHAYRLLYEQIAFGRLPDGRVLSENQIAEELGISRTPVGEAIRQLVQEGLLEQVPRFGTIVRQIDECEMQELFEMREALEGYAAVRASKRISPIQIAQLKLLSEEIDAVANEAHRQSLALLDQSLLDRFLAADMAFHYLIICAAGNGQIAKAVQQTQAILNIFRVRRRRHDEPLIRQVRIHHDRIIAALEQANADEAKRAMIDHLVTSKRETLDYLREHAGTTEQNPVLKLQLPDDLKHKLAELESDSTFFKQQWAS